MLWSVNSASTVRFRIIGQHKNEQNLIYFMNYTCSMFYALTYRGLYIYLIKNVNK